MGGCLGKEKEGGPVDSPGAGGGPPPIARAGSAWSEDSERGPRAACTAPPARAPGHAAPWDGADASCWTRFLLDPRCLAVDTTRVLGQGSYGAVHPGVYAPHGRGSERGRVAIAVKVANVRANVRPVGGTAASADASARAAFLGLR